jgi:TRAP-type transport system periplasmic protein
MTSTFVPKRRTFLTKTAAIAGAAAVSATPLRFARAAGEFKMKMATTIPVGHPINDHAKKAAAAIAEQTGGRVMIEVFPGYVLGSSTSALSQVRGGSIEMITLGGSVLGTAVPLATIQNTAFAFKDYDQVFAAMDGPLGDIVRAKINAIGVQSIGKHWDLGFRYITTSNRPVKAPADLHDMKLRVPVAPLFVSAFRGLGSAPVSINFDEVYTALQTRLVDGQENDVFVTDTAKLYEVQKYCARTNHIWEGYYTLVNGRVWKSMPADLQQIVAKNMGDAALREREEVRAQSAQVEKHLQEKGLLFNDVDREAFRDTLRKAGFYAQCKETFGAEAWNALEKVTGPLA